MSEEKKSQPTRTRKEAEAARKTGLAAPRGSKEARVAARARDREARETARKGMLAGDPRYFGARDAGPVRARVRELTDSRFSVGEIFVPLAFVVLLVGMVPSTSVKQTVANIWMGTLLMVIIDTTIFGFSLKRKLAKEFSRAETKGTVAYGILRALQIRRFRIPPPQVGVGGRPVKPRKPRK